MVITRFSMRRGLSVKQGASPSAGSGQVVRIQNSGEEHSKLSFSVLLTTGYSPLLPNYMWRLVPDDLLLASAGPDPCALCLESLGLEQFHGR